MKYTKIQYLWGTGGSDKITMPLYSLDSGDPYVVTSISGLEPPEIAVNIAERNYEGGVYQGRRPANRFIVANIRFQPNYSAGQDVATLRTALYKFLSPNYDVPLRFRLLNEAETEWVETSGYISKMEPSIFSKDPEIVITMACLSPYFENSPAFHPSPATFNGQATWSITTLGDAPSGFYVVINLTANANPFKISNQNGSKWLQFNYAFLSGDKIWIDTRNGQRSAKRTRSAVDLNLLPYMSSDSTWLQLSGGVTVLDPNTNSYTVEALAFNSRWWGF